MRTGLLVAAVLLGSSLSAGERIAVLGDSITHGGQYVGFLQLLHELRCPQKEVQIINCGLGGESAEGGLARFDYNVLAENPDTIAIMFGMNDIGRNTYGEGLSNRNLDGARKKALADYERNLRELVARARKAKKRVILFSPTPYDEYGAERKCASLKGCNEVGLRRCAEIVRKIGVDSQVEVLELYPQLTAILKKEVNTPILADRVHPGSVGSIIIAGELFLALGNDGGVCEVEKDAAGRRGMDFEYAPKRLPLPKIDGYEQADAIWDVTGKLNREIVRIKGLPEGRYSLAADGEEFAVFTSSELARGVNIALLDTPNARIAANVATDILDWIRCESDWQYSFHDKRKIAEKGGDPRSLEGVLRVTEEKDRAKAESSWKWMEGRRNWAIACRKRMHELAKPVAYRLSVTPVRKSANEVYVSPTGNDFELGTRDRPFRTIEMARNALRKAKGTRKRMVLLPGEYPIKSSVVFDERDSGLTVEAEKKGSVVLQGGEYVTGWRKDGRFMSASVPWAVSPEHEFKVLIVNGKPAHLARWPNAGGTLTNEVVSTAVGMSALMGWFGRETKYAETHMMPVRPGDVPDGLSVTNALIRFHSSYYERVLRLKAWHREKNILELLDSTTYPMGTRSHYAIDNIVEGMQNPGDWYCDRAEGRVYYWPKAGEDMARARVMVPRVKNIFRFAPAKGAEVANVTLCGLIFEGANSTAYWHEFGATRIDSAVSAANMRGFSVRQCLFRNLGGMGLVLEPANDSTVERCGFVDVGAAGLNALSITNCLIRANVITRTGTAYSSACGMELNGMRYQAVSNRVSDIPYSGIMVGGSDFLVEGNTIVRPMRVQADGAAIYGSYGNAVLRNNTIREVRPGIHGGNWICGIYADEGAHYSVFEGNRIINCPWALQMNTPRGNTFRGNRFENDASVDGCLICCHAANGLRFDSNVVTVAKGKIWFYETGVPGIVSWEGNSFPRPEVMKEPLREPVKVFRAKGEPTLDGAIDLNVWPSGAPGLSRRANGVFFGGDFGVLRCCHDGKNLFVAILLNAYRWERVTDSGNEWHKHDGAELSIGKYRLRGFSNGTVEIPPELVSAGVRGYAGKPKKYTGNGIQRVVVFSIPFSALGIDDPRAGTVIPFNAEAYQACYSESRFFERLSESGELTAKMVLEDK